MLKLSWESGVSAGVTIGGVNGMKGCLWNISPQHTWEEMLLLRLLDAESRGSSLLRTSSSWADSSRSALEPSCDLRCSRRSMGTCFLAWIKQEWRTTRWNWTFFRSLSVAAAAVSPCWWWRCAGTCSRQSQPEAKTPAAAGAPRSARRITGRSETGARCHGDRTARCDGRQYPLCLKKGRKVEMLGQREAF